MLHVDRKDVTITFKKTVNDNNRCFIERFCDGFFIQYYHRSTNSISRRLIERAIFGLRILIDFNEAGVTLVLSDQSY